MSGKWKSSIAVAFLAFCLAFAGACAPRDGSVPDEQVATSPQPIVPETSYIDQHPDSLFLTFEQPGAYKFDFHQIVASMKASEDFFVDSFYLINYLDTAIQYSFNPAGEVTSFYSLLWTHGRGESEPSRMIQYRVSGLDASGNQNLGSGSLTGQPSKLKLLEIAAHDGEDVDLYAYTSGGFPYNPWNPERFGVFVNWYDDLDLQRIVEAYTVGDPASYVFTTEELRLSDIEALGGNITFLDCSSSGSGGQIQELDYDALKRFPEPGTPGADNYAMLTLQDKDYYTIVPRYLKDNLADGASSGIWEQTFQFPEEGVSVLSVADNLIVLCVDRP